MRERNMIHGRPKETCRDTPSRKRSREDGSYDVGQRGALLLLVLLVLLDHGSVHVAGIGILEKEFRGP